MDEMVDAIALEAKRMKEYLIEPVDTIYFGGGTPSLLNKTQLNKLVDALYKHFTIVSNAEFTLEANPDDLTRERIISLVECGVNRLSIGTQSFDDSTLQFLNRSHSVLQAKEAVSLSKDLGIHNISLDLIYGIPDQSKRQWEKSLEELVALNPNHISCYALTIEEKTAFGQWIKKGKLKEVDENSVLEEYDYMVDFITASGFEHYEVSNFAKPGSISKHNSAYWHRKSYLGLGPGAHSFNGKERHFNIANNPKYIKSVFDNKSTFTKELLSNTEALTEYIFTRIRTKWGVDFSETERLYGYSLSAKQLAFVNSIVQQKIATFVENKIILNSKGYFLSDSIALELIPEP